MYGVKLCVPESWLYPCFVVLFLYKLRDILAWLWNFAFFETRACCIFGRGPGRACKLSRAMKPTSSTCALLAYDSGPSHFRSTWMSPSETLRDGWRWRPRFEARASLSCHSCTNFLTISRTQILSRFIDFKLLPLISTLCLLITEN